jgi:hypothetical protein
MICSGPLTASVYGNWPSRWVVTLRGKVRCHATPTCYALHQQVLVLQSYWSAIPNGSTGSPSHSPHASATFTTCMSCCCAAAPSTTVRYELQPRGRGAEHHPTTLCKPSASPPVCLALLFTLCGCSYHIPKHINQAQSCQTKYYRPSMTLELCQRGGSGIETTQRCHTRLV